MVNLTKKLGNFIAGLTKTKPDELTAPRAWLIDPENQTVTPQEYTAKLVSETLGPEAEGFNLDNNNNILWCLQAPTNQRHAYYFARMVEPFSVRRYNRGLIISLGPDGQWDKNVIADWLRWYDKQNIWGD
jgi:hypothetical protein